MTRTPQSHADLQIHLAEQLAFLERSADAYDQGFTDEAKRLAVVARVLFHDTKFSRSVLAQLGRKDFDVLDTAAAPHPGNLVAHMGLVSLRLAGGSAEYVALLDDKPNPPRWLAFKEWWNATVFIDDQGRHTSRRSLVLALANQDGGAHVDPALDTAYADLSRNNSLALNVVADDGTSYPMSGAERAAMRQIAHEILKTLKSGYAKVPKQPDGVEISNVAFRVAPDDWGQSRGNTSNTYRRNEPCFCGSGRRYKHCHGGIQSGKQSS